MLVSKSAQAWANTSAAVSSSRSRDTKNEYTSSPKPWTTAVTAPLTSPPSASARASRSISSLIARTRSRYLQGTTGGAIFFDHKTEKGSLPGHGGTHDSVHPGFFAARLGFARRLWFGRRGWVERTHRHDPTLDRE